MFMLAEACLCPVQPLVKRQGAFREYFEKAIGLKASFEVKGGGCAVLQASWI